MVGSQVSNKITFLGAVTDKELLPYTIICDTVAQIPDHQSIPTRWLLEMPLVTDSYGLNREKKIWNPCGD